MTDSYRHNSNIYCHSVARRAPSEADQSNGRPDKCISTSLVEQMESKSNLYPKASDAPPQYGEFGGPSMIPTETQSSSPPVAVITVQQPNVFMQGGTQTYLGRAPTMATCPSCQARQLTTVNHEPSTKTHLFALLICLVGGICCCCIPYCVNSCQNATHTCSSCGAFIGSYQN